MNPTLGQFGTQVIKNTWRSAWKHFEPTREHLSLYIGISVVTFVGLWIFFGKVAVTEEIVGTIFKSVLMVAGAFSVWFILVLFAQPYSMWAELQKQLNELSKSIGERRKYRDIARKIEATITAGQVIQTQYQRADFVGAVNTWFRFIETEITPSLIDEDRAMFSTLVGPIVEPIVTDDRYVQTEFHEKMGRAIAKLRMIMARYYRAAEKQEARELQRDADNDNVDTS